MRLDFGRILIFLLVCLIGQYVIQGVVVSLFNMLGWYNPIAMLLTIDVLIGFLFAYLYYPKEARRGIFRNPNFYRDAGMFALVWLALDLVI
jgi:uncharacterized membrane protein